MLILIAKEAHRVTKETIARCRQSNYAGGNRSRVETPAAFHLNLRHFCKPVQIVVVESTHTLITPMRDIKSFKDLRIDNAILAIVSTWRVCASRVCSLGGGMPATTLTVEGLHSHQSYPLLLYHISIANCLHFVGSKLVDFLIKARINAILQLPFAFHIVCGRKPTKRATTSKGLLCWQMRVKPTL